MFAVDSLDAAVQRRSAYYNSSRPISSVAGPVLYHGFSRAAQGLALFFASLFAAAFVFLLYVYVWRPRWSQLYYSVPYFNRGQNFVVFVCLLAACLLSVLQVVNAFMNEDWEALGTLTALAAALLGLRTLHWLMHSPSELLWFIGLATPTGGLLLAGIYAELEELARQLTVLYYAETARDATAPYVRDVVQSSLEFVVLAALAALALLVAFVLLVDQAYRFKYVTRFRQLLNVQRATVVMSINCMVCGLLLALGTGFFSIRAPTRYRNLNTAFLALKWLCLVFIGSSSVAPMFFAILERSSRIASVIAGLTTATFVSLICNTALLAMLGTAMAMILVQINSSLSDPLSAVILALFAFFAANALSILLLSIFFVGWRQLPDGLQPQHAATDISHIDIARVVDFDYIVEDKDIIKIPRHQIEVCRELGAGGFGVVHLGRWQRSKDDVQLVAIKQQHISASSVPEDVRDFIFEIKFLSCLTHPNIVTFLGVVVLPAERTVWLLTEYLQAGNLGHLMQHNVSLLTKARCLADVAVGMAFLHSHVPPIVHRDLKLENVLLSADGTAKIADFGLTTLGAHQASAVVVGSLHIVAPEILRKRKFDERVDAYSFGILAGELLSNISFIKQLQMLSDDDDDQHDAWQAAVVDHVLNGIRPVLPISLPVSLRNLVVECWSDLPSHRPPFTEISQRLTRICANLNRNSAGLIVVEASENVPLLSPCQPPSISLSSTSNDTYSDHDDV